MVRGAKLKGFLTRRLRGTVCHRLGPQTQCFAEGFTTGLAVPFPDRYHLEFLNAILMQEQRSQAEVRQLESQP